MTQKPNEKRLPKDPNRPTYGGQIVEKPFVLKNGQPGDFNELYFRASVQDYFIKFCESKVSRAEIEPFIDKGITVEATIHDGLWDQCPDDAFEVQSRMGTYMTIEAIVTP